MRIITLTITILFLSYTSFSQKIKYNIPEGYEKLIDKGDYKRIVDMAVPIIAKRYQVDQVKDGAIQLKSGQEMQVFNLHNLITKCVGVTDKSAWKDVIEEHFNNIFSSIDEEKKMQPESFDAMSPYLSLRIYPKRTVIERGGADNFITRVDLEDTYTMLMLDLPGAFKPVDKNLFDLWKKDTVQVFTVAQQNVNKQSIEKVAKSFDVKGGTLEINLLGNEDYAASYALDLANNSPELVGEWGSIVVIPNKGLVDVCKISSDKPVDFVQFIQLTKATTEQFYRQHAQPVSDQYFWYYKGKFTRVPVLVDDNGNVKVLSPMGLTELMTEKK